MFLVSSVYTANNQSSSRSLPQLQFFSSTSKQKNLQATCTASKSDTVTRWLCAGGLCSLAFEGLIVCLFCCVIITLMTQPKPPRSWNLKTLPWPLEPSSSYSSQHIVYENVIKVLKRSFVLVFFFPFFRVPEEREGPMGPQDHQEPGWDQHSAPAHSFSCWTLNL